MKKWKYHVSHSFIIKDENKKVSFLSQLYKVGIYAIINGDPSQQLSLTPKKVAKMEKNLIAMEKKGLIINLKFGPEMTVTKDENGFFVRVK
ncbi:MAG TPA: hypothetical protein VLA13_04955 [Massilibacterium sp.]|nr:hypothetical protein [Massilibacterium sp.]